MAMIEGDIIKFHSSNAHFWSEQTGIKKFTLRRMDNLKTDGITDGAIYKCRYVQIKNTDTEKTFTRRIKTVFPVDEKYVILSW